MPEPASFRAPIGTHDVLPPESARWEALLACFAGIVDRAGYGLVQSPMFEDAAVFARLGAGTEVVGKEMYVFEDRGGRQLALRPEGTAPVARAYAQHRPTPPWKAWYVTPCFRYESPQAGRYRQHHQVGIEAIGSADPDLDVEVIATGHDYLHSLGLRRLVLLVNSMGTPDDRRRYAASLQEWLSARTGDLHPDDRPKVAVNPLRVLDSKRDETRSATADAPRLVDQLSPEAATHFERVLEGLGALGLEATVEPRLVRGLDYYTHTTFELQSLALDAAQNTVLGGGRYDGLVEDLGGPPASGIGFGSGIERVLLACDAEGVFGPPDRRLDAWVVDVTDGRSGRDLTAALRRAGFRVDRTFDGRSMKAQMKRADASGARVALIVGEQELADGVVTARDLRAGGTQERVARDGLVPYLTRVLEEGTP